MSLKFRNLKFGILCKMESYFLFYSVNSLKGSLIPFWNKQNWVNKIICFSFLKKVKLYRNLVPETVRLTFTSKYICDQQLSNGTN